MTQACIALPDPFGDALDRLGEPPDPPVEALGPSPVRPRLSRAFPRPLCTFPRPIRIMPAPGAPGSQRPTLGSWSFITVPDKEPSPVGPTTTRPVVTVDASQRLQYTLDFTDESTSTRQAKPAGVIGAEISVKVAPARTAARPRRQPGNRPAVLKKGLPAFARRAHERSQAFQRLDQSALLILTPRRADETLSIGELRPPYGRE